MKFADIPGHDATKQSLRRLADAGRLPHAILLSGPAGIGKLAMARALAQYVHCTNRTNGDSCGQCAACRQHESFNFPDMHYDYPIVKGKLKNPLSSDYYDNWKELMRRGLYAGNEAWLEVLDAGNSQPVIYVSQSQDLLAKASLSTYGAEKKIFLIWQPEKMNPEAANKLLKVIEEPFADTLFILVSDAPQLILPTIFSRTQRFRMSPLREEEIMQMLLDRGIEPTEAIEAARIASGRPAKALEAAGHAHEPEKFAELFQELMRMAYSRNVKVLKDRSEAAAAFGREKTRRYLAYIASQIRENFIYNIGEPTLNRMRDAEQQFSVRFSPFINERNVEQMMKETTRAANDIERNANSKIVLFDLYLKFMTLLRI